jgi:pimeloyl-ACP methyl ester carboxylesterase
MRERIRIKKRGLHVQMPGLVTGSFLENLRSDQTDASDRSFQLPTKLANVNGAEFHYFEFGEGEPVLFVHGSIGDYRTWGYQFESFAQRYRVISYSRRYHYPNTWSGDGHDYSTSLHADDLAAFLTSLGSAPAHLIGQSLGATIAAHCARYHPDVVRSLVVVEPTFPAWFAELEEGRESFEDFKSRVRQPAVEAMMAGDAEECVRIFCDGVLGEGTFASLSPEMRTVMLDNAPELKLELQATELFSPFTFDDARRIAVPTLSIEAGASPRYRKVISRKFAECVPYAERAFAPESPHAVHFMSPATFNDLVLRFLERHSAI